jgi:hypothetical protein
MLGKKIHQIGNGECFIIIKMTNGFFRQSASQLLTGQLILQNHILY